MKTTLNRPPGSAMVIALIFSVILFAIGVTSYSILNEKYRVVHHAANWQESLLSAEAGIDFAMNEIRRTLYDPPGFIAGTADGEWKKGEAFDDKNNNKTRDLGETYIDANNDGIYNTTGVDSLRSEALARTGEGGTQSLALVTVDTCFKVNDEPYYRIRSMGITDISGPPILAGDKADISLRKLSLRADRRTREPVPRGQARRYVEAIAKPVFAFKLALMAVDQIDMNNENILVDSWDSTDPLKSNNGAYPGTMLNADGTPKVQWNGDIATNGPVIDAGNARIFGTAGTNGGDVLGDANVSGHREDPELKTYDDYYQDVIKVLSPTGLTFNPTVTSVSGTQTLLATAGTPSSYKLDSIRLAGSETLRIKAPVDAAGNPLVDALGKPIPSYIQIVVDRVEPITNSTPSLISMTGSAQIIIDPGVFVRMFVEGGIDIGGNGFSNPNSSLNLQIYGITPPEGVTPLIKIAGNGGFKGAIYAPEFDLTMVGGGTTDSIYGSFVAKKIRMTGVQSVHYDEALADGGLVVDYQIASWFEEDR